MRYPVLIFSFIIFSMVACQTPMKNIFGRKSPHEQYGDKLIKAGLQQTALGRAWFDAAERSLNTPSNISLPYREAGYFSADAPRATTIRFNANRGKKIQITLNVRPGKDFIIYADLLYDKDEDKNPRWLASTDSSNVIEWEIAKSGTYLFRLQPELLKSGDYTLTITNGPSLAYPIKAKGTGHIQSFWHDPRDEGARKHEGVDLFTPRRTPAVAAAEGTVVRVNTSNLGGNVVWMKPKGKNYVLYYAHLDTQLVKDGQSVDVGDTLGLVGNTGNARFTVPHLHFGIYTASGAIDPLHFVKPSDKMPPKIDASLNNIGKAMQSGTRKIKLYKDPDRKSEFLSLEKNTPMLISSANDNWYHVILPDDNTGYVDHSSVSSLKKIMNYSSDKEQPLLEKPDSLSAHKAFLNKGDNADVMGVFRDYYFVVTKDELSGWIKKD